MTCNFLWRIYRETFTLLEFSQLGRYRSDVEFWEEFADEFIRRASRPETDRYTTWQLSKILPDLDKSSIVVDLGCGFGRLTLVIAQYVRKVYAIDQCFKLLRYLREKASVLADKIEVLCARWDNIEPILARIKPDVAVISHSFDVDDVCSALQPIIQHVRKAIHIFVDFYPFLFKECYRALLRITKLKVRGLLLSPAALIFLALTSLDVTPRVDITIRTVRVPIEKLEEFLTSRFSHVLPLHKGEFKRAFTQEVLKEAEISEGQVELTRVIAHIHWRKS